MLEELEEDVDGTTTRLAAAQRKLTQVIKKSGMGGQIAIIICLIVTLVVLMVIAVARARELDIAASLLALRADMRAISIPPPQN